MRSILIILPLICFASFNKPHKKYALTRVCIDAGHGGHDSGCISGKAKEKDVALAISLKLGKYIEDNFPDVKVIYTRKTDVFVELHERAAIANNAKADLFICIHCNSACYRDKKKKKDVCNDETSGLETWVMGLHKSEANLEVSKRENDVVLLEKDYIRKYDGFDPNSPEANIIFSLYQNAYLDQSLKMASFVQAEAAKKGRPERGVKQAGFLVLFKTYMPSVLIETGFLTNPSEAKYLTSDKGQDALAQAFFQAFKNYKASVESGDDSGSKNQEPDTAAKEVHSDSTQDAKTQEAEKPDDPQAVGAEKSQAVRNDSVDEGKTATRDPVYKGKQPTDASSKPAKPAATRYEFAVQIVTSTVQLKTNDKKFKGVRVLEEQENKTYKYTTEKVATFEDAAAVQKKMKANGFPDAFIVAYRNSARIPLRQAREEMEGVK